MRLLMVFMLAALQLPGTTVYLNGSASVYGACLQGATLSDVAEFDHTANGFARTVQASLTALQSGVFFYFETSRPALLVGPPTGGFQTYANYDIAVWSNLAGSTLVGDTQDKVFEFDDKKLGADGFVDFDGGSRLKV